MRRSITGPVLLILIGVLFLTRDIWRDIPIFEIVSVYWPFVLILWGVLRLIEVAVEMGRGRPLRAGLSGGEVVLIILLCVAGSGLYVANRHGFTGRIGPFGPRSIELFGEAYEYQASDHKPAPADARVVFENLRGNIRVNGGEDATEIRVEERKTIRAFERGDADRTNRATPLEIITEGNRIVVRTNQERISRGRRIASDLDVTVPRGASILARASYGDFDITGIAGGVDISSDNAGVRLTRIGGNARIDLRRSDVIRAVDVQGDVDLQGRGNDVDLQNILGQVRINGSYSGTLEFKNLGKPLIFEGQHTELRVEKVLGSITMDLGDFTGKNLMGPIRLITRSRDVRIEEFTHSLELENDRGDMTLRPAKDPFPKIDARCHSGNIELSLPENAKFDLRATTSRGEARNDFGPPIQVETSGRSATLRGSVGSGPSINVITENGTVSVKKGGGEDSASL